MYSPAHAWCSQHLFEMHTTLSAKSTYALVHARICNCAEASLPWKLLRTYLESCASIVQAVVCRPLLLPLLLSRPNPSPDAVCSRRTSSKSALSPWRGPRCGVAQASLDHPLWCRPHPVCLWVALALGRRPHPQQSSIFAMIFAGFSAYALSMYLGINLFQYI